MNLVFRYISLVFFNIAVGAGFIFIAKTFNWNIDRKIIDLHLTEKDDFLLFSVGFLLLILIAIVNFLILQPILNNKEKTFSHRKFAILAPLKYVSEYALILRICLTLIVLIIISKILHLVSNTYTSFEFVSTFEIILQITLGLSLAKDSFGFILKMYDEVKEMLSFRK